MRDHTIHFHQLEKKTGARAASAGAHTLRLRQSSLVGVMSDVYTLGTRVGGWMQEGPNWFACKRPLQGCLGTGGFQRNAPTGGAA